jgi:hypothetical protein
LYSLVKSEKDCVIAGIRTLKKANAFINDGEALKTLDAMEDLLNKDKYWTFISKYESLYTHLIKNNRTSPKEIQDFLSSCNKVKTKISSIKDANTDTLIPSPLESSENADFTSIKFVFTSSVVFTFSPLLVCILFYRLYKDFVIIKSLNIKIIWELLGYSTTPHFVREITFLCRIRMYIKYVLMLNLIRIELFIQKYHVWFMLVYLALILIYFVITIHTLIYSLAPFGGTIQINLFPYLLG